MYSKQLSTRAVRVRYDPPAPLKEAIVTSILTALFANAIRLAFWPTPIWFFSPLWCAIWLAGEACAEFIRYFFKPKLEDPSSEGFLNRPRILQDFLGGVMRGAFMVLFWGKIEAGNEGTTRFYWTTFAMTMLDSAATLAMALTAYCDQYRSSSGPSSQHTARTKMEESLAVAQV